LYVALDVNGAGCSMFSDTLIITHLYGEQTCKKRLLLKGCIKSTPSFPFATSVSALLAFSTYHRRYRHCSMFIVTFFGNKLCSVNTSRMTIDTLSLFFQQPHISIITNFKTVNFLHPSFLSPKLYLWERKESVFHDLRGNSIPVFIYSSKHPFLYQKAIYLR
jgi:hypothetical protein